jgi:AcrR family transcriptional regulator
MRSSAKPKPASHRSGHGTPVSGHETVRWRRRKDARPQEILEAALSVFAEKGFAAARMDDIAARAHVSKGTIYLYFESKEAVFRALVQATLARRVSDLAALARNHRGPIAPLLRELILRFGHFVATSDLVVLPKMVIAEAGNFPDLARIYREEVVERGLALLEGLMKTGMERGEFRKLPVNHAARLCVAPLLLAAIWRTTFARLDPAPYDYAGLVEAHVSTLLRGLELEEQP